MPNPAWGAFDIAPNGRVTIEFAAKANLEPGLYFNSVTGTAGFGAVNPLTSTVPVTVKAPMSSGPGHIYILAMLRSSNSLGW